MRAPGPLRFGAVLLVAAVNLRAAIAVVPPLLDRIQDDLHLSAAGAGVLTTLPVVCMGVFAPPAQRLAARLGREATVGWALVVLTAGTLVRLAGSAPAALYGGTLLAGLGIAVTQTLLPGVVKQHFAGSGGLLTGLYSTAMAVGATVAAAVAVPVADLAGSWQRSVAVWSLPAAAAALVWWPATAGWRREHRGLTVAERPAAGGLPWRSRTAWLISTYFAVQSLLFYSQLSWLAPLYQQRGWSEARAGVALSVFNLLGIAGSLSLPSIAGRLPDRRPVFAATIGACAAGLFGVALAPTALPWLWIAAVGVGQGGAFALGLLLLVDYAPDPAASARLSAMAFLVGYSVAALGPVALGALRDATGDFRAAFLVLAGLAVLELAISTGFTPARRRAGVETATSPASAAGRGRRWVR